MKEKQSYIVPECEAFLVQVEGTIALSKEVSVDYKGLNPEEQEW